MLWVALAVAAAAAAALLLTLPALFPTRRSDAAAVSPPFLTLNLLCRLRLRRRRQ